MVVNYHKPRVFPSYHSWLTVSPFTILPIQAVHLTWQTAAERIHDRARSVSAEAGLDGGDTPRSTPVMARKVFPRIISGQ